MGHWNNGVLEFWFWWKKICFYMIGRKQKYKNRPISAFDSQNSIFPAFHYSMSYLAAKPPDRGEVKAWSSGPESFTYNLTYLFEKAIQYQDGGKLGARKGQVLELISE
jgi:hypothetical protein